MHASHLPVPSTHHARQHQVWQWLLLAPLCAVLAACGAAPPISPATPTVTILPTATPHPPIVTAPPTATAVPATATLAPPTATPMPPTDTPEPPTATLALPSATPPSPAPLVAVLAYHHFGVPAAGDYDCPLDKFEDELEWLKRHDYQSISPQQYVDVIHGQATLPAHPVIITFDDNNGEQYTDAAPLLEKYSYHGAFFVDTVTIGKQYYMTAAQLQDLARRGHTIGTHTWDHRNLAILTPEEVTLQLERSESDYAAIFGHKPAFMSYPFGTYNADIVATLKARGYHGAFRLRNPDDPVVDPAFSIHRQIIPGVWSLEDFENNVHWMEP